MKVLPNSMLRSRWIHASRLPEDIRAIAQKEWERCAEAPGWNPKVIKLRRDLHLIDVAGRMNGDRLFHSAHVALVRDHPFLATLEAMGNAPRVVKSLYRKEVRLAYYRGTDALPVLEHFHRADKAWEEYIGAKR